MKNLALNKLAVERIKKGKEQGGKQMEAKNKRTLLMLVSIAFAFLFAFAIVEPSLDLYSFGNIGYFATLFIALGITVLLIAVINKKIK